ncbi:MAG: prolyl oligopeptidase family serine peptidase [Blastocatellia bacterium]|nr:prolyl oligopeptidase family serine peptidase [Blastocatellia bacterium]
MFLRSIAIALLAASCLAQAPQTNKPIPPAGIEIPAADRAELQSGVEALGQEIETLRIELKAKPKLLELLPDVQIFYNAVHYALKYNEILHAREIPFAKAQLQQGFERAKELRAGKPSWTTQTGLVVRGYVSRIDGSVQPYGLVVPTTYQLSLPFQYRLDIWFHGRSETLTEINFINDRQKNPGQFTPPNTFVLHPYGRYCNANKFAGEVDTFEALAHIRKHYPIDENRISVRGFSMGGAATWHFATHHAGLWAAAAPGAGFAETAEYLKLGTNEPMPAPHEQTLWHLYNATDYAANLFNLPTVAYSGEIDRQIQAANVMAREMKKEGLELTHIIGPQTEHKYHPDAIPEINRRIDSIVAKGRNPVPRQVKFTTFTLRYNKMFWVIADGLEKHWERARLDAEIKDATTVIVKTSNVSAFTLEMPSGLCPLNVATTPTVLIDGQKVIASAVQSDRSWKSHFRKSGKLWAALPSSNSPAFLFSPAAQPSFFAAANRPIGPPPTKLQTGGVPMNSASNQAVFVLGGGAPALQKEHGLQGPIDDAFLDSFIFVRPTGKSANEAIHAWVNSEMNRAITQWRTIFRGEAQVKNDDAITEADIANSNLILWGDVSSNKLLARVAGNLPIQWTAETIQAGLQKYASSHHIPILIYPNPLNPKRYIVLNSGFTFREGDHVSNSRQTPKLPDWAIVDITTPPSPRSVGKIVNTGFFGERWELK